MRNCAIALLLVLGAVALAPKACHAQFRMDTVRTNQVRVADTSASDTGKWHMTKSPLLALTLSAILPGAGQVYCDQWWKVPIIYAGFGSMLYGVLIQNFRYHYTSDSVSNQLARGDVADANLYQSAQNFYHDDRDKFIIYSAVFYIANVLDAYIASHLYDFDVSDEPTTPASGSASGKSSQMLSGGLDHYSLNFHLHF